MNRIMKVLLSLALVTTLLAVTAATAQPNSDEKSAAIVAAVKAGRVAYDVLKSWNSEHDRIQPIIEEVDGQKFYVYYVPMINEDSRCSLNWAKDVFQPDGGKIRVELINVPDENVRALVNVQGKGDKQGKVDRNRGPVFKLKSAVELDWGAGHSDDRAFYWAERNGFDAGRILPQYPAAAFKVSVLKPRS